MREILIVDDNISYLIHIGSQLSDDYHVLLAKSGEQALHICAHERPDLILLDVEMPGMNGFETIEKLQKNPALAHIPAIFLTADHDASTEAKALKSGARDFITKPVGKKVLLHRIELHLRISSYQSHLSATVKEMTDNIAASFAELIECRDENTGGHVIRTSKYVELLGEQLLEKGFFVDELSGEGLPMMVRATPLHDIGKIVISDRILLKPGRLDDGEFATMKLHTVIGSEILGNMHKMMPTQTYLQFAIRIAASHHERYDGNGYPYGLAGDDIPLCGRIMAIADVYDALVDNRVYRRGMSHVDARRIILDGSGSQFDPRVVEVFEECNLGFAELAESSRLLDKDEPV
jgi:putative two-component system response regulator